MKPGELPRLLNSAEAKGHKAGLLRAAEMADTMFATAGGTERAIGAREALHLLAARLRAAAEHGE